MNISISAISSKFYVALFLFHDDWRNFFVEIFFFCISKQWICVFWQVAQKKQQYFHIRKEKKKCFNLHAIFFGVAILWTFGMGWFHSVLCEIQMIFICFDKNEMMTLKWQWSSETFIYPISTRKIYSIDTNPTQLHRITQNIHSMVSNVNK